MTNHTHQGDILIVDDTPANLQLLSVLLKERGYRARPVPNGRLALQAAANEAPELILLDINMPEMNGYEVCERLKQDPALRDIPVIFLSALTDTLEKVKAFSVGGVDYITKPFHFEEVEVRVQTHLKLVRQRRELEDNNRRLRELEQARDALTHMIVHDLRSPLSGILMNLELLRMESPEGRSSEDRESIDGAFESTTAMIALVSDLLDVHRFEAGELTLNRRPCDLAKVVRRAVTMLGGLAAEREIHHDGGFTSMVSCDEKLIERVVMNLVGNAVKFTSRGQAITVSMTQEGRSVRVAVSDTGRGIAPEHHSRIFEKFGQVHTRGSDRGGSGLGLTFCKLATEAHGGAVGVISEVGRGSTFWFTLPVD